MVGNLIALIAGAYLSSRFYLQFYDWVDQWININDGLGKIFSFILLFVIAGKLVELVFILLEKAFKIVAFIPGTRFINNILGAFLGLFEGALFIGLILFVVSRYLLVENFFTGQIGQSVVAPWLFNVVEIILPLLPDALKTLQSVI